MSGLEILKDLACVIPVTAVGVTIIVGLVSKWFKPEKQSAFKIVMWISSILITELFILFNGLSFGLQGWDYLLGIFAGFAIGSIMVGLTYLEKVRRLIGMKANANILIKDEDENSRILEPTVKMRERNKIENREI